MRYENLQSFQKHLSNAAPNHLCHCYLVMIPDDYERQAATQMLLSYFINKNTQVISFVGSEVSFCRLSDALLSPSLFGGEPIVSLSEVEKLGKKDLQSLAELTSRLTFGYLLCSSISKGSWAIAFEQAGVVLDLTGEKPWDKEKRLIIQMAARAMRSEKRLASDAAGLLLERIGADPALLDQEIDKLICYVGEKSTIERSDIFRVSVASRTYSLWQIAEKIVWDDGSGMTMDAGLFHGLIPSLRSQLQIGIKIAELLESRIPLQQWSTYFPKIGSKILEKRSTQVARLGYFYFKRGLDALFTVELLSRTGAPQHLALLDFFRISMHYGSR